VIGIVLDALSWVLVSAGVFFIVVGSLGLIRMPDIYTRLHAAGMTDSIGAGCILVALAIQSGFNLVSVRLMMVWGFLLLTSPIATHALARAARAGGVEPYKTPDSKD